MGTEIVSPIRDAMGLVDDEHGNPCCDRSQNIGKERLVRQHSGEMSRMSKALRFSATSTALQSSLFSELIVNARTPMRSAAAIWLRISASNGEISRTGPAPSSRNSLVAMK